MQNYNEKLKGIDKLLWGRILALVLISVGAWALATQVKISSPSVKTDDSQAAAPKVTQPQQTEKSVLEEEVLPSQGVVLPVVWGDLGAEMINAGVIDKNKFTAVYAQRGGLSKQDLQILEAANNGQLKITADNSGFILNLLWALGLGNKSDVLDKGEMANTKDVPAGNFASTGGWTLAQGEAMDHYSKHSFLVLTSEQQAMVDRVSRNIYRPCCGNSTHFPDCNHGMAMLGFLELMASQGVSETDMYKYALAVNSYWFPDTYLTIAQYFASKDLDWKSVSPKDLLSANYSSASGYQQILQQVAPPQKNGGGGGGGSCGV